MSRRKRRRYTPEFKSQAVALVLDEGLSVAQAARDLSIPESVLGRWTSQERINRNPRPDGPLTTEERAELNRLRREVNTLKMEREILKKAAAWFAKETL